VTKEERDAWRERLLAGVPVEHHDALRQAALDAFGRTPEERKKVASAVASTIASALKQECKKYNGQWWLWSLGAPVRSLTDAEIKEKGLA
jgi:hypothetical protein